MGRLVQVIIFQLAIGLGSFGNTLPLSPHFMILDILNKIPALNQDMRAPPHPGEPSTSNTTKYILAEISRMERRSQRSNGWKSLVRVF